VTGMSKSTRMAHREILLQRKTQSLSGHGGRRASRANQSQFYEYAP
jgi:hypothetical protein